MSEEDKELLARIGQLAGQINRHKNQQTGSGQAQSMHPAPTRHNQYRHSAAPYAYSRGGYRGGRGRGAPAPHRHRTLHLNNSRPGTEASTPSGSVTPDGSTAWVTRNDRHRQLINANVYEKEAQNRVKAIEETRQRKMRNHRYKEKMRFNDFMLQQVSSSAVSNPSPQDARNELTIAGLRFRVMDGGKKLARIKHDSTASIETPKTTTIAGVVFHRTKTGNLVANRVVQDHRRSGGVKKIDVPCRIFSSTGSCPKGPSCRFIHDPHKVAVCKDFLKDGKCANGESCDLSHELTPERVPNCLHYAKGYCAKPDCVFTHSKAAPTAPVCEAFGFCGYCDKGAECGERHVFECPDFSNTGVCKNKGCKLPHRERASVLRGNAAGADQDMDDVSSDDGSVDLDDVDSDDVAEFIEADSDDSDYENPKDFLPI
ncbi:CCCH zinc finger protein [Purpureocillium lilacinum]|uniref:CCCH zinc finger protein n=1 Tax=Purpureocillium lilacinum TaxID=33203 RepID=A0A179HKG0_PURLI|nr:CCCH zinc finger protein [Purpureocillium lilacinum]OAQ84095.1 CCCH zinc finger protein [Purpureocillium lilacinum]OAQ90886.1 CCCH zinc finger protein [Purpureocillium lilacinum]